MPGVKIGVGTNSPLAPFHLLTGGGDGTGFRIELSDIAQYVPLEFWAPIGGTPTKVAEIAMVGSGGAFPGVTGNTFNIANFTPTGGIRIATSGDQTSIKAVINYGNYWCLTSGGFGVGTDIPNSTIQVAGSFAAGFTHISSNTTLDATHCFVNCTANTFTVTLPSTNGLVGREYTIKNSGTGVITVDTTSGQFIDGQLTEVLAVQYSVLKVITDGSNWFITQP